MALTKISTDRFKDDAVTTDKLANAINTERTANTAKDLTALSASNLTSGTIPDARLPATLPAASAANLTSIPAANITGTLPAIDGSNLTGVAGGISDFDTWYITSTISGNTDPVVNNWSRWTSYGGTGSVTFAAPSTGVFTFPSTGYWYIEWNVYFMTAGNNSERGVNCSIYRTENNSSFAFVTEASGNCHKASDNTHVSKATTRASLIFDVTDTSTHKVRFVVGYNQVGNAAYGHGAYLPTYGRFMLLKET